MASINNRISRLEEESAASSIRQCVEKLQRAGRDIAQIDGTIEWLGTHVRPRQPGLDENSLAIILDALPRDYAGEVRQELLRIAKEEKPNGY